MRKHTWLVAALLLIPGVARAQDNWSWSKDVARGQSIEIKGINGEITATLAPGSAVKVTAQKSAKRSDTDEVKLQVVEHAGGVTICAVYPTPRGEDPNECRPGEKGHMSVRNNDVKVHFEVQVPRGVKFIARNVNGAVEATGLQSEIDAHTVNGGVELSTSGLANAQTVNGAIVATIGAGEWDGDLNFETVNGGITVAFAGEVNTNVRASTVNGSIDSDYPVTVQGRFGPKRVKGTIGKGGRDLYLTTVNGGISLLKR